MKPTFKTSILRKNSKTAESIKNAEDLIKKWNTDILAIKAIVVWAVEEEFRWSALKTIEKLRQYYKWVEQFLIEYWHADIKEQVWKLFTFKAEKLLWPIKIRRVWPVLNIIFSEMQDLLSVKFAQRKDTFTQEDRAAWFLRLFNLSEIRFLYVSLSSDLTAIVHLFMKWHIFEIISSVWTIIAHEGDWIHMNKLHMMIYKKKFLLSFLNDSDVLIFNL